VERNEFKLLKPEDFSKKYRYVDKANWFGVKEFLGRTEYKRYNTITGHFKDDEAWQRRTQ